MQSFLVLLVLAQVHFLLGKARLGVAELVQVHAVGLGTRLVLHKVATVLGCAQAGFDQPAIDEDIVDALDGAQAVVAGAVRDVG